MTTIRSYKCNFCQTEHSDKSSFHPISEIIGLKWETRNYGGTPYDKTEKIEILKEINVNEAENHICKRCLDAIQRFIPHYITLKDRNKTIKKYTQFLNSFGYDVIKKV